MSIDKYHLVKSDNLVVEVTRAEAAHFKGAAHAIYVMWSGVEHLYFFEAGAEAAKTFDEWRRPPCESITLTLNGVRQNADRLPLGKPGDGCDCRVDWNGEYDLGNEPEAPADWPVFCGQPDVDEVDGRRLCKRHQGQKP